MADGDESTGQASGSGATGAGQAPPGQQGDQQTGQAPGDGQGNGQPAGQSTQPDLSAISDPELRAWVEAQARQAAEARQEAARYRTDLRTVQQQMTQFRQQHETDEQRAQREAQERDQRLQALEAENRTLKIAPQFTEAAAKAKVLDPGALLTLVGGLQAIEVDGTGKATNLDGLIASARTQYPYLFGRTTTDAPEGGQGGDAPSGSGMNDFIRGRASAR